MKSKFYLLAASFALIALIAKPEFSYSQNTLATQNENFKDPSCNFEKSSSGSKTKTNSTNFPGKCSSCHPAGTPEFQSSWITTNIPGSGYVAGNTYNIYVTASHSNAIGNLVGFALSCEDDATNNNKGTFDVTSAEIQMPAAGCVTMTSSGNTPDGTGTKTWTIPWTAPSSSTGSVTFFMCSVTGENGGGSNGFSWYSSHNIAEDLSTSIGSSIISENGNESVKVFPNPNNGLFNINLNEVPSSYEIIDMRGKVIVSSAGILINESNISVDINDIDSGVYFLKVNFNNDCKTVKFIVK